MQEQAALLPGSQAGEEGTSVWSHGAHGFPLSAAPPARFFTLRPLHLRRLPITFYLPSFGDFLFVPHLSPLSPPPLPPLQRGFLAVGEGARTNKHATFFHWRPDVLHIEGYFYMSLA